MSVVKIKPTKSRLFVVRINAITAVPDRSSNSVEYILKHSSRFQRVQIGLLGTAKAA